MGSARSSIERAQEFQWSSVTGHLNNERLSSLANYVVGRRLLDAGCGGGGYVDFLSQQGLEVVGLDREAGMLRWASQQHYLGSYVLGDVTSMPFADKMFDTTYCFDVLEHVDDFAGIRELARVTRQRLIIAVPRENDMLASYRLTFLHYSDHSHLRNYNENTLRSLMTTIECREVVVLPELAVPMRRLVRDMVQFAAPLEEEGNPSQHVKTSFQGVKQPPRKVARKGYYGVGRRLLSWLLKRASYRMVYTGLVAVVDLTSEGRS